MRATERLEALLAAAARGEASHAALDGTKRAVAATIEEESTEPTEAGGLQQHRSLDLVLTFGAGFAAFDDPALDEGSLATLLAALRSALGAEAALATAWDFLSSPAIAALACVLCRRTEVAQLLPRAFAPYQSELCLVCVHLAASGLGDDSDDCLDILEAAQFALANTHDVPKARAQFGRVLLGYACHAAQLLRLGQGDPTRLQRVVQLVSATESSIAVAEIVSLFDRAVLTLGASPRTASEPEGEAVVALLKGCAEGDLTLRKEIYGSAKGLMLRSSSGPTREMCLRLMVAVVGTQRPTVVGELSSLLRRGAISH